MSYALHANQTVALRPGSGVFGMALGAREGFVDFSIVDFQRPDISTSLDLGYSPPAGQVVRIPIHSVDWLVATGAVTEPAIMKIDVQGGEHDVISGARKSLARTQVVMLETWAYRGYGGRTPILLETVNLMASHGFDVFEVGHPQFDEAALLCNLDVWFVNRRCRGQLGLPPI